MAEIGDVMTDYIATTTAAVSVGPVSGLPRLDYLNSSCPRLLLEPQRTNSALYSEQADNSWWLKFLSVITPNQGVSPSGYNDADLFTTNSPSSVIYRTGQTAGSLSFFVKAVSLNSGAKFGITVDLVGGAFWNQDGTLSSVSGGTSTNAVSYGNGWYRCAFNVTSGTVINYGLADVTGTGTCLIWGMQNEPSATYPTSYIPTLGTSVTRVADAASKTGISSLIGQTEGTIFAEVDFDAAVNTEGYIFRIDESSFDDTIFVSRGDDKILNGILRTGGSTIVQLQKTAFNGVNKLAFAYKSGSFALYVNGTQVATSAATYTNGITYDDIRIGGFNATTANMCGGIKQLLLFRTRLSNSDLAALTA
jgi:hypothetical protein